MLIALAIVLVALCVAASLRRLAIAIAPIHFDPTALLDALRAGHVDAVLGAIDREPRATWERGLVEALRQEQPARDAFVGEQLTELDGLAMRMVRVPRACASLCTSGAFLLAALSLRDSLSDPTALGEDALHQAITRAVNIASIGVAGTMICIAVLVRARKIARARKDLVDRFVERMERLVPSSTT